MLISLCIPWFLHNLQKMLSHMLDVVEVKLNTSDISEIRFDLLAKTMQCERTISCITLELTS